MFRTIAARALLHAVLVVSTTTSASAAGHRQILRAIESAL